jgi:RNA polymerase sigma factor (sigma-70 family)
MHDEAFAEFVEKYRPELVKFACSKVTQRDHAEDVVQNALLSVYERAKSLSPDIDPRPYFYEAVRFEIGKHYRKDNGAEELDVSDFTEILEAPDSLERVEVFADFERAIARFEPDEREVLVKFFIEGWTTREIEARFPRRNRRGWEKWLKRAVLPHLRESLKDYF